MTIRDTCEQLWKLEDKYSLLQQSFGGFKIWQAYRMYIYYDIAKEAGILDTAHTEKKTFLDRLSKFGSFFKSCFFDNPFFSFQQRNSIIFDHKRKVKVDNRYIDIYTNSLISEMRENGQNLEVWEQPYNSKHFTNREPFRYHLDFPFFLSRIIALFMPSFQSKEEIKVLNNLEANLKNQFKVDINLKKKFSKYIKLAKAQQFVFKNLFRLKNPKKLFIVVAYGQPIIVSVAKKLGIEVIELQHGIISKYHMGYSYPHINKPINLDHFPNQIWLWNDFWKSMAPFPIDKSNLQIYPFQHIESMKKNYKKVTTNKDQILVISQGAIGDAIANQILKDVENLDNYKIIFKLHPGEINHWKRYTYLTELSKYSNVKVNDGSEKNIYELMAESDIVIGVFSTAIFESLSFGCSIYLLDLPGIENMLEFINDGNAVMIPNEDYISNYLYK